MKNLIILLFILAAGLISCSRPEPSLKIGLVADPQYADKSSAGNRYYRESLWKLEEAVDTFNYYGVDFVQSLGDIIDGGRGNFDSILPVYRKLNPDIENHHLLGNHDLVIDSVFLGDLPGILSMPGCYYSYVKESWRFIVLDATDYSYYANLLHKRDTVLINAWYDQIKDQPNHKPWNGAIGNEQQEWLKRELEKADSSNQNVIIFSHMPLRPLNTTENLWNDYEIIRIIEHSSGVKAFINGHRHSGNYVFKNGIHYITVCGMVENMINSYGILEIYKDRMVLRGYGNQKSYLLSI